MVTWSFSQPIQAGRREHGMRGSVAVSSSSGDAKHFILELVPSLSESDEDKFETKSLCSESWGLTLINTHIPLSVCLPQFARGWHPNTLGVDTYARECGAKRRAFGVKPRLILLTPSSQQCLASGKIDMLTGNPSTSSYYISQNTAEFCGCK